MNDERVTWAHLRGSSAAAVGLEMPVGLNAPVGLDRRSSSGLTGSNPVVMVALMEDGNPGPPMRGDGGGNPLPCLAPIACQGGPVCTTVAGWTDVGREELVDMPGPLLLSLPYPLPWSSLLLSPMGRPHRAPDMSGRAASPRGASCGCACAPSPSPPSMAAAPSAAATGAGAAPAGGVAAKGLGGRRGGGRAGEPRPR